MRKVLSTLLSAFVLGSVAFTADAVPARPGVLTVPQADGSNLRMRLYGDEHHHYRTTEDGYLLVADGGNYYYATMENGKVANSGRRAVDVSMRSASDRAFLSTLDSEAMVESYQQQLMSKPMRAKGPGTFPGTSFPSMGNQKGLVILVEYSDVKFQTKDPYDYFSRMLNEKGFKDYGATGSARDWYIAGSNGNFQPDFDVFGPVTLSQKRSYYGGNNYAGDDQRPAEMIIEACQLLAKEGKINFADYDRDKDGYIDNVYVFYAGTGEASGGPAESVWPHSWDVTAYTYTPYYFDGVRLDRYACSNEWFNGPDGIGTFCHEFGHVMGLPDVYATSYSSAFTPGMWDVMDRGSYNNDSRTPPTFNAFERYALGWIDPVELDGPTNCTLNHILDSNEAYLIKTDNENEYFILENRQQSGWDKYIPGHGMLVWHIDYDDDVWTYNTCNNDVAHQYIDLEEADGSQTDASRSGDAFPGTRNVTSFTDDTRPSMKSWSGKALGLPITEIAEDNDGVITFKVAGGLDAIYPPVVNPEPLVLTYNSATMGWSKVHGARRYYVTFSKGNEVLMDKVDVGYVTSYTFENLDPETTYSISVIADGGTMMSEPSATVSFTTLEKVIDNMMPVLGDPTELTDESVTLNWAALDGASEYLLSMYVKNYANPTTDVIEDGYNSLPAGWTTTSTANYASNGYYGASSPAIRLDADAMFIESPRYDKDIMSLSFWVRGTSTQAGNSLSVLALVDGEWVSMGEYPSSEIADGRVINISYFPADTRKVKLLFNKARMGNLAIDDIKLTWGGDEIKEYTSSLNSFSVGNVTSYNVTGLQPDTRYYYTVQGKDGDHLSLLSAEGTLKTKEASGIINVIDNNQSLSVATSGLRISVNAPVGSPVTVSDLAGRIVAIATSYGDNLNLLMPAPGLYIVKAGASAVKVLVK